MATADLRSQRLCTVLFYVGFVGNVSSQSCHNVCTGVNRRCTTESVTRMQALSSESDFQLALGKDYSILCPGGYKGQFPRADNRSCEVVGHKNDGDGPSMVATQWRRRRQHGGNAAAKSNKQEK